MRNILQIAKEDLRKVSLNAISLLVCIGLVCIPCVYAWFNIGGSWDPYGNTSQITIGVINDDEGFSDKYLPIDINIGDTVVSMLYKNSSFKWEVMDKETAMQGLDQSYLYAAIEIPKDFSKNMMSILTDDTKSAELIYYDDEKKNALASKITGKGADAIKTKVNNAFSETVLNALFKTANNVIDFTKSENVKSLVQKLSTGFGDASLSLKGASLQLESVKDLIASLKELFASIQDLMPGGQEQSAQQFADTIAKLTQRCDESIASINEMIQWLRDLGVSEDALQTLYDISTLLGQLKGVIQSSQVIGNDVIANIASLQNTLNEANNLLDSIDTSLNNVQSDFEVISSDMTNAKNALDKLKDTATLDKVQEIIGSNPKSLAQLISAPIKMDRIAVFPVANTGSSMAAFYTALSIWVGCTILLAIMKVKISPARINAMNRRNRRHAEETGGVYKPVKWRHIYFGRYIIFAMLALAQATLICLGEIFFLGIQCVHPLLFLMTGWLLAILFSFLIYTLVCCFGNIGKAIAVILLVLQIAASGGMFPSEMICWPFNLVYEYLPMTYALDSFHLCIAGFAYGELYIYWIVLILYLVPISLIMGLALRRVFVRGQEWFTSKIQESKLIG